jgi:hypothetical protein
MNTSIDTSGASTIDDQSKNKPVRSVGAKRVADFKRKASGAKKRVTRLNAQLKEFRTTMRRKSSVRTDAEGKEIGRTLLGSEDLAGLKLKSTETEKELAVAKRDYLVAKREYMASVKKNQKIARQEAKDERAVNNTIRRKKRLEEKTQSIVKALAQTGNEADIRQLREFAAEDKAKDFRQLLDTVLQKADPEHYAVVSGVTNVKKQIVKAVMEQIKKDEDEVRKMFFGESKPTDSANDTNPQQ